MVLEGRFRGVLRDEWRGAHNLGDAGRRHGRGDPNRRRDSRPKMVGDGDGKLHAERRLERSAMTMPFARAADYSAAETLRDWRAVEIRALRASDRPDLLAVVWHTSEAT